MYADSILDVLDPTRSIFYKRIYRNQCLRAVIPSPSSHPMQDLLPNQDLNLSNKLTQTSHSSSRSCSNDSHEDSEAKTVYIKDLRILEGVDLSRVVIVDN